MVVRSPICSVLGHVDHGKSTILDSIRGTAIVESEAGAITQEIGASVIPLDLIQKICGPLITRLNFSINIPGLLFIDTPGHAAFSNFRKRGGNLADIAILAVDIMEGPKPQTFEAIEILRSYKTPFVIAANKIDRLRNWSQKEFLLLKNIEKQLTTTKEELETKTYELVSKLADISINSNRFDRITDFKKEIAIVPCSAKTGEGMPELLMILMALVQKYLSSELIIDETKCAKGTILDVKKTDSVGTELDLLLYEGILSKNEEIVIGTLDEPIVTKVKAILKPEPLTEIRDAKGKFKSVDSVSAAAGVKIIAKNLDKAIDGMPVISTKGGKDEAIDYIKKSIEEVLIKTDEEGIIIKANSLGTLEALLTLFKKSEIKIRKATIGSITKKDIVDANILKEKNPLYGIILGFNVDIEEDAKKIADESGIVVFLADVIYKLLENYTIWKEEKQKELEVLKLKNIVYPFKFRVLRGYVFRQSNPCVVGVEVLNGVITVGKKIINGEGKVIGYIKSIQKEKDSIKEVKSGEKVALAIVDATFGRHIFEEQDYYSNITESEFKKIKELREYIDKSGIHALKEITTIKRKNNPLWGV
jgi:translation initiation factor 5B